MKVNGVPYRTIWPSSDDTAVEVIDQTRLPHAFSIQRLASLEDAARAIKAMIVRGAPLIGATAAYGVALAMLRDPSEDALGKAYELLLATRPTAVNLRWALDNMRSHLLPLSGAARPSAAFARAAQICDEDVALNRAIGEHGLRLLEQAWNKKQRGGRLQVMTHCNAGWLATVDWGTALAPIYLAFDAGIPLHVWVSETRPRNQGAALTAWELEQHGVAHTVIVDNAAGLLMRRGEVDVCLVGTDRTTSSGDVCNKIGTYLKALAAHDNGVPFYVALPSPTLDPELADGSGIPLEHRSPDEVLAVTGRDDYGQATRVTIAPANTRAINYAFDVTPARLVTGLLTERGVVEPAEAALAARFPERFA